VLIYCFIPFFALSWSFIGELWMSLLASTVFLLSANSARSTKKLRQKLQRLNNISEAFKAENQRLIREKQMFFKVLSFSLLAIFSLLLAKLFGKFEFFDLFAMTESCLSKPQIKITVLFALALWFGTILRNLRDAKRFSLIKS
jgi:hypothetical protein